MHLRFGLRAPTRLKSWRFDGDAVFPGPKLVDHSCKSIDVTGGNELMELAEFGAAEAVRTPTAPTLHIYSWNNAFEAALIGKQFGSAAVSSETALKVPSLSDQISDEHEDPRSGWAPGGCCPLRHRLGRHNGRSRSTRIHRVHALCRRLDG